MNVTTRLSAELALRPEQIGHVLELFEGGATVPFLARYRKEATGGLDEEVLRTILDRHQYLKELEGRKETILRTIDSQGKLTDALRSAIEACQEKARLEDLYLPYRPKRRTRAALARERGLQRLLEWIQGCRDPHADLEAAAAGYVNPDQGVATPADALKGAADILAEESAERAENRTRVREIFLAEGMFVSRANPKAADERGKYEMYYDFRCPVRDIPSHNLLALRRAEREEVVSFEIEADDERIIRELCRGELGAAQGAAARFIEAAVRDGYERLLRTSITAEVRAARKHEADLEAIRTFEKNLRALLLAPPAGEVGVLALDPGFRSGCKVVALDPTGKFLEHRTVYPNEPQNRTAEAARVLERLIRDHRPAFIAVGNGTACRETERFAARVAAGLEEERDRPRVVIVNESGASVYSASPCAREEFPDLDVTIRGAVSIGRRLQDPLAELVKIEPRSIGVGQYQHDVDQTLLKKKLSEVVESCVHYVGVDLNTASVELLAYVSGINAGIARGIVERRNATGPFRNRKDLLEVPRLGPKAFEQAAGFLRIRSGDHPLDNTAVHPERYILVGRIAAGLGLSLAELVGNRAALEGIAPERFVDESAGLATIRDILEELRKPGRDPRRAFTTARFRDDVAELKDLKEGMVLEGTVTNVTNFGAFVDIGVHQDGLVHVSQMAEAFVRDPTAIVQAGQLVTVRVLAVDLQRKRISLSMRPQPGPEGGAARKAAGAGDRRPNRGGGKEERRATLEDLVRKFNR